jgi:ssDNA thymidine ADP-ribosyltransferase, DarT
MLDGRARPTCTLSCRSARFAANAALVREGGIAASVLFAADVEALRAAAFEGVYYVVANKARFLDHVLDLDGVIIADRNAASTIARFDSVAEGIERLEETVVFAKWWNDSIDANQRRMAEVLVPVNPALFFTDRSHQ